MAVDAAAAASAAGNSINWSQVAAGAASSAVGAGAGFLSNLFFGNRNWRRTKQQMSLQNQYNLENWEKQNAYNHPSQQVARLKAAGLNPNLIYGNGTASAGLAGDIGSPSGSFEGSGSFDASNGIAAGLGAYQNWQLNKANLAHINADRQRLMALTSSEMYRQALMAAETSGKNLDNAIKDAAKSDLISSYKANNDLRIEQARSIRYQADVLEKTRETAINQAEVNLLKSKGELLLQKLNARVLDANAENLLANARLAGVNASLGSQQFDFYGNEILAGRNPFNSDLLTGTVLGTLDKWTEKMHNWHPFKRK